MTLEIPPLIAGLTGFAILAVRKARRALAKRRLYKAIRCRRVDVRYLI